MNGLYVLLGCSVASVSLLTVAFQVGRWAGRNEEHLKSQDQHLADQDAEIAELHTKLDKLAP